jgi:hypothetical protein
VDPPGLGGNLVHHPSRKKSRRRLQRKLLEASRKPSPPSTPPPIPSQDSVKRKLRRLLEWRQLEVNLQRRRRRNLELLAAGWCLFLLLLWKLLPLLQRLSL